jgi:hypothetical protein
LRPGATFEVLTNGSFFGENMKFIFMAFISLLLAFAPLADGHAAEPQRLSFAVICDDPQLAAKIEDGIRSRFADAKKETSNAFPAGKLFLYLQRDLNDRKNPEGVSVAIAHVSNVQTAAYALGSIQRKEPVSDQLGAMLREEGFLKHLSVAHLDEPSDEEIRMLLDSVVNTFFSKYPGRSN